MLQIFNYHQNSVTFRDEEGTVMVNATEMAKPFGKRPVDWTRLPSTLSFLDELSNVKKRKKRILFTSQVPVKYCRLKITSPVKPGFEK